MEKDCSVSLRIGRDLRESLSRIAREEARSLSAIVESILVRYVEERAAAPGKEMRRYRRQDVTLPALVSLSGSGGETYSAMVLDISLAGMKISLPKEFSYQMREDKEGLHLDVRFPIPREKMPVILKCRPVRVEETDVSTDLGTLFADCSFDEYCRVRNYVSPSSR